MKLYTKKGDEGETSLFGGKRVSKTALRVCAYGDVDEANSFIGLALIAVSDRTRQSLLEAIQNDLFALQAQLADPAYDPKKRDQKTVLTEERVTEFEAEIDRAMAEVGPLKSFVLPGGSEAGARLHVARTAVRRAERSVLKLAETEGIPPMAIPYLNRLSDLLFALALACNRKAGVEPKKW